MIDISDAARNTLLTNALSRFNSASLDFTSRDVLKRPHQSNRITRVIQFNFAHGPSPNITPLGGDHLQLKIPALLGCNSLFNSCLHP